jgi:hypothetical protein
MASHASNTWETESSSTRRERGGPPSATTAEPVGLRGSHSPGASAPYKTSSGSPQAAAACAGPVSIEIMLCARSHRARRRRTGNSATTTCSLPAPRRTSSSIGPSCGAPHNISRASGSAALTRCRSAAQFACGHALSSAWFCAQRSRRRLMVRKLPGWISTSVRPSQRCWLSHASSAARSACETASRGAVIESCGGSG